MNAIGLTQGEVMVVAYSPLWKKSFEKERNQILNLKHALIKDVVHVGSTSIPKMSAKPIIDIMIGVDTYIYFKKLIKPLASIGFEYKFEPRRYQALFVKTDAKGRDTHYLKVLRYEGKHWNKYLRMREVLLSDKKLFNEYKTIKIKSSKLFSTERKKYTESKKEIIKRILTETKKCSEV